MGKQRVGMRKNLRQEEEPYFDSQKLRHVRKRIYRRRRQDQRKNGLLHHQNTERGRWHFEYSRGLLDRYCAIDRPVHVENRRRQQGDTAVSGAPGTDLYHTFVAHSESVTRTGRERGELMHGAAYQIGVGQWQTIRAARSIKNGSPDDYRVGDSGRRSGSPALLVSCPCPAIHNDCYLERGPCGRALSDF